MPLTKTQKAELLEKLVTQMGDAKAVVFADYQGMSVKDLKELRDQLREAGVTFTVAKKTLIKIAADKNGFGEIDKEILEGPVGAAFSMQDEVAAAKILHNFGKKNKNLKLRGALFEGKVLSIADTKALALIPGKDELIAKFIYLVKSPVTGFHGVLNNTITGFVRALDAIKEQKEA